MYQITRSIVCNFVVFGMMSSIALAEIQVAVLGPESETTPWCSLLTANGFNCNAFPPEGPAGTLDPFDVVVAIEVNRPSEAVEFADYISSGRGLLWFSPIVFSAFSFFDPVVQGWVDLNRSIVPTVHPSQ